MQVMLSLQSASLLLLVLLLPTRWCFELLLKYLVSSIIVMLEGLKVRYVLLERFGCEVLDGLAKE